MTERDAWGAKHDRCFLCGVKAINTWPPKLESHEIARGPSQSASLNEPCTWIRTCQRCHSERLDGMPVVQQLALKLLYDLENFDRVRVNQLRNRADNAISEGEVDVAALELEEMAIETGFPFPRWRF